MQWNRTAAAEWGCIVGGIVPLLTGIVWLLGVKPPNSNVLFPALALVSGLTCAVLFYLGKRLQSARPTSSAKDSGTTRGASFYEDDPHYTTVRNQKFRNQTVELDGKRFEDCEFENTTILFHGHAPTEMIGSVFSGSLQIVADDPAINNFVTLSESLRAAPHIAKFDCVLVDEHGHRKEQLGSWRFLNQEILKAFDTTLRDSDPQLEIKIADLRGKTGSSDPKEQACFDLINRGKHSPAKFACLEDFYIGGYYVAFRNFLPPIKPFGNHDSITPHYINKPDGTLCDKDIFTILFWAWDDLKNPKLYEYTIPIKATYQDEARNLFEVRCDLVFYPFEHTSHRMGQSSGTIIETKNHKIRKVAAVLTPVNWSELDLSRPL